MSGCNSCSRRDFVATGTLAAVGAFLAACGGGDSNPTAPAPGAVTVTHDKTIVLRVDRDRLRWLLARER